MRWHGSLCCTRAVAVTGRTSVLWSSPLYAIAREEDAAKSIMPVKIERLAVQTSILLLR